jgi:hypothetical protein
MQSAEFSPHLSLEYDSTSSREREEKEGKENEVSVSSPCLSSCLLKCLGNEVSVRSDSPNSASGCAVLPDMQTENKITVAYTIRPIIMINLSIYRSM